jgi:aspartyl protease family protein
LKVATMASRSAAPPWLGVVLIGVGSVTAACAQSVSYSGSMGGRALLVIDGTPRTLAAGATHGAVRLVSVNPDAAVV